MSYCPILNFLNSEFIAALSGGLIGGVFTFIAVKMTINHERAKLQQQTGDEIKAICSAIETEMHCLMERYKKTIGADLIKCKDGEAFNLYYPVEQEYFAVFHANTAWIGKIKSAETREAVVVAYIAMKGLIDSYKHNNQMLMQYEGYLQQAVTLPQVGGTQQKFYNELQQAYQRQLVEYAPTLKESHLETLEKVNVALKDLRAYISSL